MATGEIETGNGMTKCQSLERDIESIEMAVDYPEVKSTTDHSMVTDIFDPKSAEELYAALTDKTRAIEILKRRLTNQQIQLGYYLHKNLATEAVLEFSNKCVPHLAEDSTQLSLAMYKFLRDTGGKTRLAQLREKLTDFNNRVHKVLLRQEQLVRQGLTNEEKLEEFKDFTSAVDDLHEKGDELRFAKNAYKTAKLEMCSQLLSVTLQVRKELERFRICAESVVRLEDERNALVDRVFSIPPEERFGSLHVSMVDHDHHRDLDTTAPSMTSVSTSTSIDIDQRSLRSNLGGALHDMESEAIQLLFLSEKQKNEFVIALEEARVENQQLKERLRDLEDAASDERVIQLQQKCDSIEREVEIMRKDLEAEQNEKERVIRRMALELDNRDSSERNLEMQIKQMKSTIQLLRDERNILQKKVEIDSKKPSTFVNQNTNTDEILTRSDAATQDVEMLTDLVVIQEGQIKDLLSIMSELKINELPSLSIGEKKSTIEEPPREEQDVLIVPESVDSGLDSPESKVVEEEPEIEQPEDYNIFFDSASDFSNQNISEYSKMFEDSVSNQQVPDESIESEEPVRNVNRSRPHQKYFSQKSSRYQIPDKAMKYNQGLATTSLRVQSFDKDGKRESMHAVLECSSPVDGLLEMNNSSKLHLRLQCTSPQRHQNYSQSRLSQNSSIFSPEKHLSGDHPHPACINEDQHMSREAKVYLTKQLNKIKSHLETAKSDLNVRRDIVHSLNEIYSQLFETDEEITIESGQS